MLRNLEKRQNQSPLIKFREMLWVFLLFTVGFLSGTTSWTYHQALPYTISPGVLLLLFEFDMWYMTESHMLEIEWSKVMFCYLQHNHECVASMIAAIKWNLNMSHFFASHYRWFGFNNIKNTFLIKMPYLVLQNNQHLFYGNVLTPINILLYLQWWLPYFWID